MRGAGTYLAWLGATLALYWTALELLPQKDHAVFMLARELYPNDWSWFLDVLSYNRTRVLFQGDAIAFRPIHMALIAGEDMLFRHAPLGQGVVGCLLFSTSAATLFTAARRLCGFFPAIFVALAWVSSTAGMSIVLWQHIAPYSLTPGLLIGAALLLHGRGPRVAAKAGGCMLVACLLNEMAVIVALAVSGYLLIAGPADSRRTNGIAFLLPAALALAINALDFFFFHPATSIMGPVDSLTLDGLPEGMWAYVGSIGVALFSPWTVRFKDGWVEDFLFHWPFWDLSILKLSLFALPVCALIFLSARALVRRARRGDAGFEATAGALFLGLFFSVCAVGLFRMATRGGRYLGEASYYYSIAHFALLGMSMVLLSGCREQLKNRVAALLFLMAVVHGFVLHRNMEGILKTTRPISSLVEETRAFFRTNPEYCFGGDGVLPALWGVLFYDYSRAARPRTEPLYLMDEAGPPPALCRIRLPESRSTETTIPLEESLDLRPGKSVLRCTVPGRHEIRFSMDHVGYFDLALYDGTGEAGVFRVDRNMVWSYRGSEGTGIAQVTGWDTAGTHVDYRISCLNGAFVLVGNDILIGRLPGITCDSPRLDLAFVASPGKLNGFREVRVAEIPEGDFGRIERVKNFPVTPPR